MGALEEAKDNLIDSLDAAKEAAVDALEFMQERSGDVAHKVAGVAEQAKVLVTGKRDDDQVAPADENAEQGQTDT